MAVAKAYILAIPSSPEAIFGSVGVNVVLVDFATGLGGGDNFLSAVFTLPLSGAWLGTVVVDAHEDGPFDKVAV